MVASMEKPNRASLTVDRLAKIKPGETLWDTNVRGLCARRQKGSGVTFYVKYRTAGRRIRWLKIGAWGSPWEPASARREALKILGEVADGHDPQAGRESKRREATVLDVLTAYIDVTGKAKKLKPATIQEYQRIRDDVIAPRIGRTRASELTAADLERLHTVDLADTPYMANRVLALISAAYNKAAPTLRIAINPARGVTRHLEEKRERILSFDEMKRLGEAMRNADMIEREGVHAIAAVAFLLLTGRRKEEALRLKWEHLSGDLSLMAVHDHKASRLKGTVYYALSAPAVRLLRSLPRVGRNPYAFPSLVKEGGHFVAIDETWSRLCEAAKIKDVRLHDLRRTHSSHAAGLGVELLSTSKMLGHSSVQVTESVYSVVEAQKLRPVANKVAGSLDAILQGKTTNAAKRR